MPPHAPAAAPGPTHAVFGVNLACAHFRDAPARAKGAAEVDPATVQRPDLVELVKHYQAKLRLEQWRIACRYAPNLARESGAPVWGLCTADAERAEAVILIRDPATPPDGFTLEQAIAEVPKTVLHELLHCRIDGTESSPILNEQATHALEEALLAARSLKDGALVSAIKYFARALRARTAPARAKGTSMNLTPEQIKAAIESLKGGDGAAALTLLEELLTAAATGDAEPPASTPEPGEQNTMGKPAPGQPGQQPPDDGMARARAVRAALDGELARARSATTSIVGDAIRVKIQRARDVDKVELAAEDERDLLGCKTTDEAERLIAIMKRHAAAPRARSGAQPGTKTKTVGEGGDPVAEVEAAHEVKVESLQGREASTYQAARVRGAAHAKASLDGIATGRRSRGVSIATGVKP